MQLPRWSQRSKRFRNRRRGGVSRGISNFKFGFPGEGFVVVGILIWAGEGKFLWEMLGIHLRRLAEVSKYSKNK